jgi:hypothetical protein
MWTAVPMSARAQVRKRWMSLASLALLVGLAGAVAFGALAGARRTQSAPERYDSAARSPQVFSRLDGIADASAVVGRIAELPDVDYAVAIGILAMLPSEPGVYAPLFGPVGGTETDADGTLVDGRRVDLAAPYEIELSEGTAQLTHSEVGDALRYRAMSPEQTQRCFIGEEESDFCFEMEPAGREFEFHVVGIIRTSADISGAAAGLPLSLTTPAFVTAHRDDVPMIENTLVIRVRDGVDIDDFIADANEFMPDGAFLASEDKLAGKETADLVANALSVFALVALLAGAVLTAQALVRQVFATSDDLDVLGVLGMDRRARIASGVVPMLPTALGGAVLAGIGAFAASNWFPTGFVGRVEPDPGLRFDATAMVVAPAVWMVFIVVVASISARLAVTGRRTRRARRGPLAGVATNPAIDVGVRLAFDRGQGRQPLPVWSALGATVFAVAGIFAVSSYAADLNNVIDSPALYGQDYDAWGFNDVERLRADAGVSAIAQLHLRMSVLLDEKFQAYAFSYESIRGSIGPSIVRGRQPASVDEAAVGEDVLDGLDIDIGDELTVAGDQGEATVTVVGTAVVPTIDDENTNFAGGVVVHPDLVPVIGEGPDGINAYAVKVSDAPVLQRLVDNPFDINTPVPPPDVDRLKEVQTYPTILAGALGLLGVLGMAHALALVVRRRSRDLALLRALGFRRRDVATAVRWQALCTAICGLVAGIPLGLLIGRAAWTATATAVGVRAEHLVPVLAWLIAPGAVVLALCSAAVPARRAARLRPAILLRSE